MANSDYVLFYSNKCLHSKELLTLLYKDNELNQKFTKINIDSTNVKIPPYVKAVPTAIITTNGEASLLVGSNIFKWYNQRHAKVVEEQGIQDWDPHTMTGYSDGFSYLENSDVMKKSFAFLTDNENNIVTPDEKNYSDNGKGKKNEPKTELDSQYENFVSLRKNDMPGAPQRI